MAIQINKSIGILAGKIAAQYPCYPTPLQQIADDELINVCYNHYGSSTFDGLTWFEKSTDDFYIHLNLDRNNSSKSHKGHFTFAHELGHYFIPRHRIGIMRGLLKPHKYIYGINKSSWQIEREADEFASCLLMPEENFKKFVKGKNFSFELIRELTARYVVSISAAAIRYAEIGCQPIMVVYAMDSKVRWVIRSDFFPYYRLRYGNAGSRVPENTVLGTYFYENDDNDCKSEEIVFAGDCFDIYHKEDNKKEFTEYCIPYKNHALSIFW
jgi:hypothetical protein